MTRLFLAVAATLLMGGAAWADDARLREADELDRKAAEIERLTPAGQVSVEAIGLRERAAELRAAVGPKAAPAAAPTEEVTGGGKTPGQTPGWSFAGVPGGDYQSGYRQGYQDGFQAGSSQTMGGYVFAPAPAVYAGRRVVTGGYGYGGGFYRGNYRLDASHNQPPYYRKFRPQYADWYRQTFWARVPYAGIVRSWGRYFR
jgi:hypothetical protein